MSFSYINPMSKLCLIYNTTIKKLLDFNDVHKYNSSYLAIFDKIVGLLTNPCYYTYKNTEIYF